MALARGGRIICKLSLRIWRVYRCSVAAQVPSSHTPNKPREGTADVSRFSDGVQERSTKALRRKIYPGSLRQAQSNLRVHTDTVIKGFNCGQHDNLLMYILNLLFSSKHWFKPNTKTKRL